MNVKPQTEREFVKFFIYAVLSLLRIKKIIHNLKNNLLSSKLAKVQELYQGFMESDDTLKSEISEFLQLEKKKAEQAVS